jgi:uncharacterized protein with PIN domain
VGLPCFLKDILIKDNRLTDGLTIHIETFSKEEVMAKCVKCEFKIDHLESEEIKVPSIYGIPQRAIAFTCPKCKSIISMTTIPIAQNKERNIDA